MGTLSNIFKNRKKYKYAITFNNPVGKVVCSRLKLLGVETFGRYGKVRHSNLSIDTLHINICKITGLNKDDVIIKEMY